MIAKSRAAFAALVVFSVGRVFAAEPAPVAVTSPDGRNEIRVTANPLRYAVLRDGVLVVAPTPIALTVDGKVYPGAAAPMVTRKVLAGTVDAPVYKKASYSLAANTARLTFGGPVALDLVARDDGVAWRFATDFPGQVAVTYEEAALALPDLSARCWAYRTYANGCEEVVPVTREARHLVTFLGPNAHLYLPFAYTIGGKFVAVTESDIHNYPIWNLGHPVMTNGTVLLKPRMAKAPKTTSHTVASWDPGKGAVVPRGGRFIRVDTTEDWFSAGEGARTLPWRVFVLADTAAKFCEADIVNALATPAAPRADFSWVRPGKVAWDWWNCFDNSPSDAPNGGCSTKTYRRFIDFAAKNGVEYVIFDEGWSEKLDIWKYHPEVDVPALIEYARTKGVGIILWMAWAQVAGDEERVASHFAKLGVKGFKVDFIDRGDAGIADFLEKFAAVCAKHKLLVDYHGVYRPVGLSRTYPNIINYEGIHGLEQMKWFEDGCEKPMMMNDVAAFFLRLTAGPMDYTPGAMENWALGQGYAKNHANHIPGSVGTRCRQMAMMALYEAPLQMLADSPTHYEKNAECFAFMAATPVVWADTIGLGGTPDTFAAAARRAKDGAWYAAAITDADARDFTLDTAFLGKGAWQAEIFRDGADADKVGTSYVHERRAVKAGEKIAFHMAPGGGFVVKFVSEAK